MISALRAGVDIPFELRVAQAIAWCERHGDVSAPGRSLRSKELRPSALGRASTVDFLVWVRSIRLEPKVLTPVRRPDDLEGGRLLAYFPDEEITDGASEAETGGFFDVHDVPPWDTWLALFPYQPPPWQGREREPEECLVSWVPAAFVPIAEAGMSVNAVGCIRWLEDSDVPLADELRTRGLLP